MAADCTYSGTTAVCCVLGDRSVSVGWVGDSRAVVGDRGGNHVTDLTTDHRPEMQAEAQRIQTSGGLIRRTNGSGPMRVYGGEGGAVGLMLTRSLGDTEMHHYGVSAEAQTVTHFLVDSDECLLMGSDGVFDAMQNADALRVVGEKVKTLKSAGTASAGAAAEAIVGRAAAWWRARSGSDNITAVVVAPLTALR